MTRPPEDGCPFCAMAEHNDERIMVFEPLNPVTPGHMLVVPRLHVTDATSRPDITASVMTEAAKVAKAAGPCNIITSVGADATQTVFHLHVHVVPRRPGDGLALPWAPSTSPEPLREALEPTTEDTYGQKVDFLRRKADLSGRELCRRVGISPSYLSDIQAGRRLPSPETSDRIATELGTQPDTLWRLAVLERLSARDRAALRAVPEPREDHEERDVPDLREALEWAGFAPPENVCVACNHKGGDHDLGNWCLVCPRPDDWDRSAKSPTGAKIDAGWCYFASMTNAQRWEYGIAALRSALQEDR